MAGFIIGAPGNNGVGIGEAGAPEEAQPPFARKWLSVAIAAWAVTPVILWQSVQTNEAQAQPVPYSRSWEKTVKQAWEPVAYPAQVRRFVPQVEAVADVPPTDTRRWLSAVSAWQAEPTRIQTQRFAPQEVVADQPPPYVRRTLALSAWQQTHVPLWTGAIYQEQLAIADDPPFGVRPWQHVVRGAWEQDAVFRNPARNLVQVNATAADDPPPSSKAWLKSIVAAWQQTYVPLWQGSIFEPGSPTPSDPPPFRRAWLSALYAWQQPIEISIQLASVPMVAVDDPPTGYRPWLGTVLAAWREPAPTRQEPVFYPIANAAVAADDPIPNRRPWLKAIDAWYEPVEIVVRLNSVPEIAQGDFPPLGLPNNFYKIVLMWQPGPPMPYTRGSGLRSSVLVQPGLVDDDTTCHDTLFIHNVGKLMSRN